MRRIESEEIIHAASLRALREEWLRQPAAGRGGFDDFVTARLNGVAGDIRQHVQRLTESNTPEARAVREALAASWNLYHGGEGSSSAEGESGSDSNSGALYTADNVDALLERLTDPAFTEDYDQADSFVMEFTRQLVQLERNGQITEATSRTLLAQLKEWVARALSHLNQGQDLNRQGAFGGQLRELVDNTHAALEGRLPAESGPLFQPRPGARFETSSEGFGMARTPRESIASNRKGIENLRRKQREEIAAYRNAQRDPNAPGVSKPEFERRLNKETVPATIRTLRDLFNQPFAQQEEFARRYREAAQARQNQGRPESVRDRLDRLAEAYRNIGSDTANPSAAASSEFVNDLFTSTAEIRDLYTLYQELYPETAAQRYSEEDLHGLVSRLDSDSGSLTERDLALLGELAGVADAAGLLNAYPGLYGRHAADALDSILGSEELGQPRPPSTKGESGADSSTEPFRPPQEPMETRRANALLAFEAAQLAREHKTRMDELLEADSKLAIEDAWFAAGRELLERYPHEFVNESYHLSSERAVQLSRELAKNLPAPKDHSPESQRKNFRILREFRAMIGLPQMDTSTKEKSRESKTVAAVVEEGVVYISPSAEWSIHLKEKIKGYIEALKEGGYIKKNNEKSEVFMYHAEAISLMLYYESLSDRERRELKQKGLEKKKVRIYVDRPTCSFCRSSKGVAALAKMLGFGEIEIFQDLTMEKLTVNRK